MDQTCLQCGRQAPDVHKSFAHVGGHSPDIETGPFCQDIVACIARWDRQHPHGGCRHCGGTPIPDEGGSVCLQCATPGGSVRGDLKQKTTNTKHG
jgi:hypothetical protein